MLGSHSKDIFDQQKIIPMKKRLKHEELKEDRFDLVVPPILECRLLIKELEKERQSDSSLSKRTLREQRRGYSLRIY